MANLQFLAKVPIFENLTTEQLQPLGEKMRQRKYHRGEAVLHQNDPGDQMHIIVQGQVRISLNSDDGREKDVALLQPGECFGEMSLFDGSNRSAKATAVEETVSRTLTSYRRISITDLRGLERTAS